MYIYLYMCVYISTPMYMCMGAYVWVHMCMRVYVYMHIGIHEYMNVCTCSHICIYACIYAHIYPGMHMCIQYDICATTNIQHICVFRNPPTYPRTRIPTGDSVRA